MHILLDTDRLTLRRFTEDDVDNLFDLGSDPEVMRYLTGGRPTSRDEFRDTWPYDGPDVIEGSEHGEVEYALTKAEWDVL